MIEIVFVVFVARLRSQFPHTCLLILVESCLGYADPAGATQVVVQSRGYLCRFRQAMAPIEIEIETADRASFTQEWRRRSIISGFNRPIIRTRHILNQPLTTLSDTARK